MLKKDIKLSMQGQSSTKYPSTQELAYMGPGTCRHAQISISVMNKLEPEFQRASKLKIILNMRKFINSCY